VGVKKGQRNHLALERMKRYLVLELVGQFKIGSRERRVDYRALQLGTTSAEPNRSRDDQPGHNQDERANRDKNKSDRLTLLVFDRLAHEILSFWKLVSTCAPEHSLAVLEASNSCFAGRLEGGLTPV